MTCLDTNAADELWVAPGITQFLSVSLARVYACDATGGLVVLDLFTGVRLASMPLIDVAVRLTNPSSDRVYLVGETGAVQCLHEVRQKTPLLYTPPPPEQRDVELKGKARPAEPTEESPLEEPSDIPDAPPADDPSDIPDDFDADDPFGAL